MVPQSIKSTSATIPVHLQRCTDRKKFLHLGLPSLLLTPSLVLQGFLLPSLSLNLTFLVPPGSPLPCLCLLLTASLLPQGFLLKSLFLNLTSLVPRGSLLPDLCLLMTHSLLPQGFPFTALYPHFL